jgi:hypothetical protein
MRRWLELERNSEVPAADRTDDRLREPQQFERLPHVTVGMSAGVRRNQLVLEEAEQLAQIVLIYAFRALADFLQQEVALSAMITSLTIASRCSLSSVCSGVKFFLVRFRLVVGHSKTTAPTSPAAR